MCKINKPITYAQCALCVALMQLIDKTVALFIADKHVA